MVITTLLTVVLLLSLISTSAAAAVAPECGGKPAFWGKMNSNVVSQSGGGDFTTVQAGIDAVPRQNSQWFKIHIRPGTYVEQVQIPLDKPCVFLEGEGSDRTTIAYGAYARTDVSSTFTSQPPNVVVRGITFKNTHNLGARLPKVYSRIADAQVAPAVAARILGDKSAFYDCGFVGVQDTLWDGFGSHYFSNCYIEGAVDFIFGSAQSYYDNPSIYVTSGGYITAQARNSDRDPGGYVFNGGKVNGAPGVVAKLGRAYGPYSRVVFINTFLSGVVDPLGWDAWDYVGKEQNFFYAEVGCGGPGSDMSKRVPWEEKIGPGSGALKFLTRQYFVDQDGWIERQPNS